MSAAATSGENQHSLSAATDLGLPCLVKLLVQRLDWRRHAHPPILTLIDRRVHPVWKYELRALGEDLVGLGRKLEQGVAGHDAGV